MGVIDVVNKLKLLAKDPDHRVGIVKDQGMLPTLVVFLENGDDKVVGGSLDVLALLAAEPQCRESMRKEPGLLEKLTQLSNSTSSSSRSTALQPKTNSNNNNTTATTTTVATTAASIKKQLTATTEFSTPTKKPIEVVNIGSIFAKPPVNTSAPISNYTLFVKGLHGEAQRDIVEKKLLNVSGVLSFWFDVYQQKAEIRARIEEKTIIAAIKEVGFTAVPWTGEGSPHANVASKKSNSDEADYLDENEDPQHSYGSGGWLGTLAIFGAKTKKADKDEGLFNKLTSSWW